MPEQNAQFLQSARAVRVKLQNIGAISDDLDTAQEDEIDEILTQALYDVACMALIADMSLPKEEK